MSLALGAADADLVAAYARCREINRIHGRSYFLATRLLPAAKRPHVHALYGFTRSADDIVDCCAGSPELKSQRLSEWGGALRSALRGGDVSDQLLPAVVHTVRTYGVDPGDIDRFLDSMAMDLSITRYATYNDLLQYMEGSAAAIGTMMLPILGIVPLSDPVVARESARQLGLAFQLTNFLRDVAEDLGRGRIYLPTEDLERFAVTPTMLSARRACPSVRALIEYEVQRARVHYRAALPGLEMLEPRSALCVRAAFLLYGSILNEIVRVDYDVLRGRAVVSRPRRAVIVAAAISRGRFARLIHDWGIV